MIRRFRRFPQKGGRISFGNLRSSAKSADGNAFPIVFSEELGQLHGPFSRGEGLRILGGSNVEDGAGIELKPWTEVFHRMSSEQSRR